MNQFSPAATLESFPPKVFISYSHADRPFAERLADDLMHQRILVWWDEWEIKVGDSLIQKVQQGITSSSYLAILLSPNSVNSAWVQEELNAALIRQLRERRVFVLPILLEDCNLPLFLQEKHYADFRTDYEAGLIELIGSIDPPDTQSHGGGDAGEFHNDYAFEWGRFGDLHGFRIQISSHSPNIPYAVSCMISVVANNRYSRRLDEFEEAGFDWAPRAIVLMFAQDLVEQVDSVILIEGDTEAVTHNFHVDPKREVGIDLEIRARRLGQDPGSDILYEWRNVFRFVSQQHRDGIRAAAGKSEMDRFNSWLEQNPL